MYQLELIIITYTRTRCGAGVCTRATQGREIAYSNMKYIVLVVSVNTFASTQIIPWADDDILRLACARRRGVKAIYSSNLIHRIHWRVRARTVCVYALTLSLIHTLARTHSLSRSLTLRTHSLAHSLFSFSGITVLNSIGSEVGRNLVARNK